MRHENKLTRPQNAGNPISEDFNFEDFTGENALGPPLRLTGDSLWWTVF